MLSAKDVMSKEVITVSPDLSTKELSEMFLQHRVSGFPVVDDQGALVGIVTEKDLIERNRNLHIPTVVTLFDAVFYVESEKKFEEEVKKLTGTRVKDICSNEVVSISPDQPLNDLANLMAEKDIHTLPVLEGDTLVGVIGKLDIIRGLAREGSG